MLQLQSLITKKKTTTVKPVINGYNETIL